MRFAELSPIGTPIEPEALDVVLSARGRTSVEVVGPWGRSVGKLAELPPSALGPERFVHKLVRPAKLVVRGPRPGALLMWTDGAVQWRPEGQPGWNGWAPLATPGLWMSALEAAGLTGWAEAHRSQHDESLRAAWRREMPPALQASWDPTHERLVNDLDHAGGWHGLVAAVGETEARDALLAWYGHGRGPLVLRPDHEQLPRLYLAHLGFDPVVAAARAEAPDAVLDGVARYLAEIDQLAPTLQPAIAAVAPRIAARMVERLREHASIDDAARLESHLSPPPLAAPSGTVLVGASDGAAFHAIVASDQAVFALDRGWLVELQSDTKRQITRELRPRPIAAVGAALWHAVGNEIRIYERGRMRAVPAATETQRQEARRALGDRSVAPAEAERYIAFAHHGLPPPWCEVEVEDDALVRGSEHIALPGAVEATSASATVLVVLCRTGRHATFGWLGPDDDAPTWSEPMVLPPVTRLLGTAHGAIVVLDAGRAQIAVRVARPV